MKASLELFVHSLLSISHDIIRETLWAINQIDYEIGDQLVLSKETIHIESLITLTTFLKHYSPYDDQIEKSFNLLSDKIFSEEEIKSSYDSKDILCSIIEYDVENKFLESNGKEALA